MEEKIKDTLLKLGISPQLNGFSFLAYGIELCCKDKAIRCNIRWIYNSIAEQFGISTSLAVQATRRAIHNAWETKNTYRSEIFRYHTKIPTALQFMAIVADYTTQGGQNNDGKAERTTEIHSEKNA